MMTAGSNAKSEGALLCAAFCNAQQLMSTSIPPAIVSEHLGVLYKSLLISELYHLEHVDHIELKIVRTAARLR